jgi:hypothetical protein
LKKFAWCHTKAGTENANKRYLQDIAALYPDSQNLGSLLILVHGISVLLIREPVNCLHPLLELGKAVPVFSYKMRRLKIKKEAGGCIEPLSFFLESRRKLHA